MSNLEKSLRQHLELDIIENECICKQDELIIELKSQGIIVTQATLSKDLRELNITRKKLPNKDVKYVVSEENDFLKQFRSLFKTSVVSMHTQEYFISIDTLDGRAKLIGTLIDKFKDRRIAGTVARRNHILILCRSISGAHQIFKELESLRI